jgi:hypothetical protein
MKQPVDRVAAVRSARLAQVAAGALALGGCGLAVFGLPGAAAPTHPPETIEIKEVSLSRGAADPLASLAPVDFGGVSGRLGLLSNAPKVEAAPVKIDETPSAAPPPPPPPPPAVRYLGMVSLGGVRLALIHDGTKQRFVGVGAVLSDGRRVKVIEDGRLVVEGPDGEAEILLAPRSGDLLTHAASPAGGLGKGGAQPLGARAPGDVPFSSAAGAAAQPGGASPASANASAAAAAARARAMADLAARRKAESKGGDDGLKGVIRDAKGRVVKDLTQDVRADELRDKLKASGRYTGKEELESALREMLEQEIGGSSGREEGSPK